MDGAFQNDMYSEDGSRSLRRWMIDQINHNDTFGGSAASSSPDQYAVSSKAGFQSSRLHIITKIEPNLPKLPKGLQKR